MFVHVKKSEEGEKCKVKRKPPPPEIWILFVLGLCKYPWNEMGVFIQDLKGVPGWGFSCCYECRWGLSLVLS